eukprot:TRINITY_DN40039_c0_g1_i1.p1 TRINITY_DN40039_c0_g1~~TRINITY_DN40039_c0_g1_i1.p1  ORF type:complete len:412 (+),score=124.52 TRINITY_DN40039_c0_g1_i1:55-1290(+)
MAECPALSADPSHEEPRQHAMRLAVARGFRPDCEMQAMIRTFDSSPGTAHPHCGPLRPPSGPRRPPLRTVLKQLLFSQRTDLDAALRGKLLPPAKAKAKAKGGKAHRPARCTPALLDCTVARGVDAALGGVVSGKILADVLKGRSPPPGLVTYEQAAAAAMPTGLTTFSWLGQLAVRDLSDTSNSMDPRRDVPYPPGADAKGAKEDGASLSVRVVVWSRMTGEVVDVWAAPMASKVTDLLPHIACPLRGKLDAVKFAGTMLCAGGVFYVSRDLNGVDLSDAYARNHRSPWATAPKESISDLRWGDLQVALEEPMLYRHLGCCDHILTVQSVDADAVGEGPSCPVLVRRRSTPMQVRCKVCLRVPADMYVRMSPELPTDAMLCRNCFTTLHASAATNYVPPHLEVHQGPVAH